MVRNPSVPPDTLLPHIVYRDVAEAIVWLTRVFGFSEHYRYGPPDAPQGAQMHLGNAWIMLNAVREGRSTPAQLGCETQSLTIFLEEVEAHCERARSAGATIVEELNQTMYGELQYGVLDLDGHRWLFSRHVRNIRPEEWGATVAEPLDI
jgi:uncharacterized glyoxalase superfamily protein PhnB